MVWKAYDFSAYFLRIRQVEVVVFVQRGDPVLVGAAEQVDQAVEAVTETVKKLRSRQASA